MAFKLDEPAELSSLTFRIGVKLMLSFFTRCSLISNFFIDVFCDGLRSLWPRQARRRQG